MEKPDRRVKAFANQRKFIECLFLCVCVFVITDIFFNAFGPIIYRIDIIITYMWLNLARGRGRQTKFIQNTNMF